MEAPPEGSGAPGPKRTALVLLAIYAVFWLQFASVRPENFGGIDEWMILSLARRGAVDVPYANRPLGLLFNLPTALAPASALLQASLLLHGHYLAFAGMLTGLLLLLLQPGRPGWALLAGTFAATWGPSDLLRLDSIYSSAYSGVTAATALVLVLLAAGARRSILVVVAAGLAFVITRIHEAPLAVLALAPLLLAALGRRLSARALAIYWSVLALGALLALLPLLLGRPSAWYQAEVMRVYLEPAGLASRLLTQFSFHLTPLVHTPPGALLGPRAVGSALVMVLALLALTSRSDAAPNRRSLALAMAVGIAGAAASYSGFILATRLVDARRTEFLATPWIGLLLAAGIVLVAGLAPSRLRLPVLGVCGGYVAAAGAVHTDRLQRDWDLVSAYPRQAGALKQMVLAAPGLRPGTLVILVDGAQAFLGSFVLHHGLDLVYGPQVGGCVAAPRSEIFYACVQTPQGIRHEPWPVLRRAWGARARHYGFDEIVVFRSEPSGRLSLLEAWPPELPPLPAGASYAPLLRVSAEATPPAARALLSRVRPQTP